MKRFIALAACAGFAAAALVPIPGHSAEKATKKVQATKKKDNNGQGGCPPTGCEAFIAKKKQDK